MSTPEKRIPPDPIANLFTTVGPRDESEEHPIVKAIKASGKIPAMAKAFWDSLAPSDEEKRSPQAYGKRLQKISRSLLGVSSPEEFAAKTPAEQTEEMFTGFAGVTQPVAGFASRTFSRLEKAIETLPADKSTGFPGGKAPGGKWLASLMAKGGFKVKELEEVGLKQFLTDNSGEWLSREQLLEKARGGRIGVGERMFSQTAVPPKPLQWQRTDGGGSIIANYGDNLEEDFFEITEQPDGFYRVYDGRRGTSSRFTTFERAKQVVEDEYKIRNRSWEGERHRDFETYKGYTEPGGENYREIVLTLEGNEQKKQLFSSLEDQAEEAYAVGNRERYNELNRQANEVRKEIDRSKYVGGHYKDVADIDNVLAHIRLKDRVLPNGEKILFVEEIQSDWSKALRKRRQYEAIEKTFDDKISKLRDEETELYSSTETNPLTPERFAHAQKRSREISEEITNLHQERSEKIRSSGVNVGHTQVPEMPFEKAEDWVGLTMKRVIDEAVQGGYDRIAWTTGEQQAKRYNLRQVVEEIEWDKENGQLLTRNKHGEPVKAFDVKDPSDLDEIVGREIAEKLRNTPVDKVTEAELQEFTELQKTLTKKYNNDPAKVLLSDLLGTPEGDRFHELHRKINRGPVNPTLKGQQLEIGGEDHLKLYNEILPKTLENYLGKQFGVKGQLEPVGIFKNSSDAIRVVAEFADQASDADAPIAQTIAHLLKQNTPLSEIPSNFWMPESRKRAEKIIEDLKLAERGKTNLSLRLTPELKTKVSGGQPLLAGAPILGLGAMSGKKEEEEKSPFDLEVDPIRKLFRPVK